VARTCALSDSRTDAERIEALGHGSRSRGHRRRARHSAQVLFDEAHGRRWCSSIREREDMEEGTDFGAMDPASTRNARVVDMSESQSS